jgi:TM2 domain-containing membrane protein YozV
VSLVYAKSSLDPRELQMLESEMRGRGKNLTTAYLLWFFLGTLFAHRFYLKRSGGVFLMATLISILLCVVLIGFIFLMILGFIWLADAFRMSEFVQEFNGALEGQIITEILAARAGGGPSPYNPAVAYAAPAPAQAWASAPTAAAPYPPAGAWGATGTSGRMTYVEAGRASTLMVNPGEQVLVGRDPNCRVRLADSRVSRQHALIQRSGNDWIVKDLGATNPTRLLGASGTAQTIQGEVRVPSGQLLIGDVLLTLFPAGA